MRFFAAFLLVSFLIATGVHFVVRYIRSSDHLSTGGSFHDLGSIYLGQTIRKSIPLKNDSSEAVEVLRWAPSCRCLNVDIPNLIIAPHSTASIILQTCGTQPLGYKIVQIKIQWRHQGAIRTLEDSCSIGFRDISSLLPQYSTIDFGHISDKTDSVFDSIRIWQGNLTNTWDNLELSSESSSLTTSETRDNAGFTVLVRLNSRGLKPGVFNSNIKIFPTQGGKRIGESLTIPVHAKIPQIFDFQPSVIQFPPSNCKQSLVFFIKLRSKSVPISSVSVLRDPTIKDNVEVKIEKNRNQAVIKGALLGFEKEGAFVGKVRIKINDNESNLLEIPFFGMRTSFQGNTH